MKEIKIEIKNKWTGKVLFEYKSKNNSILKTLKEGLSEDADLRGADLRGADLRDADLQDAYLRGAYLRGADLKKFEPRMLSSCGDLATKSNLFIK